MKWPKRKRGWNRTGIVRVDGRLVPKIRKVKNGRLFGVENAGRVFGANKEYVFVILEDSAGENEKAYLFTAHQLAIAEKRAERNPEDLLKKDRFTDFFD
jgi:hypothetical protein